MEKFSNLPLEALLRPEGYDCDCGKHHAARLKKVIIGQGALFQVGSVLRELGVTHPMIVADQNTYRPSSPRLCPARRARPRWLSCCVYRPR